MNKLVAELREFGTVNFDDDEVHARWEIAKLQCKFNVAFEDIGINAIGCRLLTLVSYGTPVDMNGKYIIRQDTNKLLSIAMDEIDTGDIITSNQFCEAFIEFRSPDEYTDLLKHERYMNFLETPIGAQILNARKWHDEMCSHGYIPKYDGNIMSVIGDLSGYKFTFDFHLAGNQSKAVITYSDNVYEMKYGAWYQPPLDIVKKFIDMVNSQN